MILKKLKNQINSLNYFRKTIENQWFYRLQILDLKIASFVYKNNITISVINNYVITN